MGSAEDVHELLTAALESWQAGQKPEELKTSDPAMHINDEDWAAGKTLKAYTAIIAPVEEGGNWRVSAKLTLAATGKPEVIKQVEYAVTTDPVITIIRMDDPN